MDEDVGAALLAVGKDVLQKLSVDAFLRGVKAALSYRHAGTARLEQQSVELTEAYELALRLLGSLLFETRANIERVRIIDQRSTQRPDGSITISFGVLDFTVSDALMPEFCRVVTTPQVLESCRQILAMLKRVDFFQRAAAHNHNLYGQGIAFARDCIKEKQIVERFNNLVAYSHKVAMAVSGDVGADASRGVLFPESIDPKQPVDVMLL